jgi:hypothetical protein
MQPCIDALLVVPVQARQRSQHITVGKVLHANHALVFIITDACVSCAGRIARRRFGVDMVKSAIGNDGIIQTRVGHLVLGFLLVPLAPVGHVQVDVAVAGHEPEESTTKHKHHRRRASQAET